MGEVESRTQNEKVGNDGAMAITSDGRLINAYPAVERSSPLSDCQKLTQHLTSGMQRAPGSECDIRSSAT